MNKKDFEMIEGLNHEDFADYAYSRPLDSLKTPDYQKFSIGQKVRLTEDYYDHFTYKKGDVVEILYSYRQKYGWMCGGRGSTKEYAVTGIHGYSAWYPEDIFTEEK